MHTGTSVYASTFLNSNVHSHFTQSSFYSGFQEHSICGLFPLLFLLIVLMTLFQWVSNYRANQNHQEHRALPTPQSFCFSRSGVGPENWHLCCVPRKCWCLCSRDPLLYTLMETSFIFTSSPLNYATVMDTYHPLCQISLLQMPLIYFHSSASPFSIHPVPWLYPLFSFF